MADAYQLKADTSLPRAVRLLYEDEIQGKVYEETGAYYRAGDYVLDEQISPSVDRDSLVEAGLLEEASRDDAETWMKAQTEFSTFIPEHEAERYAMLEYGHQVVEKDQVLALKSAGSDAAAQAIEASREDGFDERPQITEQKSFVEVPATVEASERAIAPSGSDEVDPEALEAAGVEQPPGHLVGRSLERAEGGDPDESSGARRSSRRRPGSRAGEGGQQQTQKDAE